MLRWARKKGCYWRIMTKEQAERSLGYKDKWINIVSEYGDECGGSWGKTLDPDEEEDFLEYIDDYHYENDGCNTADYEEWDDYYYERLPTD